MRIIGRAKFVATLAALVLAAASVVVAPRPARALEAGEPAPDFTLASTTGGDISLSDFRGKKWVLLEFYAADFAPT
jgi:peroxiredoxin